METEGAQPTGGRFEARIDNLLSSALQDQAREQRMLFEIVQGARAALAKAEEELGALRILIERRDQSVVDLLEARLSGIGTEQSLDRIARLIEEVAAAAPADQALAPLTAKLDRLTSRLDEIESEIKNLSLTKPLEELQSAFQQNAEAASARLNDRMQKIETQLFTLEGAVNEIPSSLSDQMTSDLASRQAAAASTSRQITQLAESLTDITAAVETQMTAYLESEQRARAALSRQIEAMGHQIEGIRSTAAAQSSETASSIAEALEPLTTNLETLSERIRQSNRRITESNSRLEAMHESILNYLATRDERLEESRDQILVALVTQITQDLSRHDRIRITTAFKQAEQHRKDQRDAARYRRLKQKGKLPAPTEPPVPEATTSAPEPKPLLKPPRSRPTKK